MSGEIEKTAMSKDEAEILISRIKKNIIDVKTDILRLHDGKGWKALGFPSWDAMCDEHFGIRLRLPVEDRRPLVKELTSGGMSTRAIATAIGVDDRTVRRDQDASGAANAAPVTRGLDGKPYPRKKTKKTVVKVEQKVEPPVVEEPEEEAVTDADRIAEYLVECPTSTFDDALFHGFDEAWLRSWTERTGHVWITDEQHREISWVEDWMSQVEDLMRKIWAVDADMVELAISKDEYERIVGWKA